MTKKFLHEILLCRDCPLWPAGTQRGYPNSNKIAACLQHVLSEDRQWWLTAEEFLAEVEARRQARLKTPIKLTPMESRPVVRIYVLDPSRTFQPPHKLIIPEDMQ